MESHHLDPLEPAQIRAVELLQRARRFVLVGHVRPDGDCLGSQSALARVLERCGKEVWIVNPDAPEPRYEYLMREARQRAFNGAALPVHDVSVLLDFCELSRTGPMQEALRSNSSKKLVVDHHLHHGEAWWDESFVDVSASATGLLVYRIAKALEVDIDPVIARGVFTALVTDTGWFKYSNTDAATLAVAAEMTTCGANPTEIFATLYQRRGSEHPAFVARLLSRLEYHDEGRLAVFEQHADEELSNLVDSDEVLDIVRSVERVEVVLYLRAMKDGGVKLSARSKTDFDVNALARKFGGGGHKKASGATIPGELSAVKAAVIAAALEQLGATPAGGGIAQR